MERIYHRYEYWECYKSGFFKNISGEEKNSMAKKVVELFSSPKKTEMFMKRVLSDWIYSSEHNLTNISLNRVAWLGQAACCVYARIPFKITMDNWRFVPSEKQKIACDIAERLIKNYEEEHKRDQLCLKFI